MYILKLVLDGFKSYVERTEIGPFDPHFNAITGYNGSGKSNIFDAICFVLGSNNWCQMRVGGPLELIYKQGATGITKASVSIVFDNHDKQRSPMQYIECDEIVVTRQVLTGGRAMKYKLNGRMCQVSEVRNLFHSVQLNIENPHFLVMQGRITKVLNMRPREILGLLEEASGTRMFEAKKVSVRKRIDGHEAKVESIGKTLRETINPTLTKLKKDKALYARYLELKDRVSEQERAMVTCEYALAQRRAAEVRARLQDVENDPSESELALEEKKRELKEVQRRLKELRQRQLQNAEIGQSESQLNQATLRLKSTELSCERLSEDVERERERERALRERWEGVEGERGGKLQELQWAASQVERCEQDKLMVEACLAGVSGGAEAPCIGEERNTLEAQVMRAQAQMGEHDTEIRRLEVKMREALIELERGEASMGPMTPAEENYYKSVRFEYEGSGELDGERVFGRICKLVRVRDAEKAIALTVAGGARWYHVVVESSREAMQLSRVVRARNTYVMLRELRVKEPSLSMVERAKRAVSEENVWLAQSLVEAPAAIRPAVGYALGDALVCRDGNMARRLTFELKLAKSVSLVGDVYNTQGTLTGGEEAEKREYLLQFLCRFEEREAEMAEKRERLKRLEGARAELRGLLDRLALARHRHEGVVRRLAGVEDPEKRKEARSGVEAQLKRLEEASRRGRGGQKEAGKECARLRGELAKVSKELQRARGAKVRLEAECGELEKERGEIEKGLEEVGAVIGKLQGQLAESEHDRAVLQNKVKEMALRHEELLRDQQSKSEHMVSLAARSEECQRAIDEYTTRAKRQKAQQEEDRATLQRAESAMEKLKSKYPKIEREAKHTMRVEELTSMLEAEVERFKPNEEELKKLQYLVNPKAAQLFDQFQREFEDLTKKMNIIQDDREAIEQTINEFDRRKVVTLEHAFESVGGDFKDIYGSLAPGMEASLEKVSAGDILEGLAIKVQLGSRVAKLTELSGGQRSLLALSLILALLKYKPAPMYILDEVDSALDGSNTQNIGTIFRDKFPQSQFIVISLKQDLLASSNALFTASFDARSSSSVVARSNPRADAQRRKQGAEPKQPGRSKRAAPVTAAVPA
ncbi:structural maintenance of chromosomes protein 2-like [Schistocerca gregaria]|uniref:structural maintenance of chromosomes protein 2-like n=1 Tax=Schistocerca gregaria TaxID=7010 RepID=UPI00211E4286|nr:structural maintenance of chromosomes protein 2-like [Schistocerca gregaria]